MACNPTLSEWKRTKMKRPLIYSLFIFIGFFVSYAIGQEAIKPGGLKISSPNFGMGDKFQESILVMGSM